MFSFPNSTYNISVRIITICLAACFVCCWVVCLYFSKVTCLKTYSQWVAGRAGTKPGCCPSFLVSKLWGPLPHQHMITWVLRNLFSLKPPETLVLSKAKFHFYLIFSFLSQLWGVDSGPFPQQARALLLAYILHPPAWICNSFPC